VQSSSQVQVARAGTWGAGGMGRKSKRADGRRHDTDVPKTWGMGGGPLGVRGMRGGGRGPGGTFSRKLWSTCSERGVVPKRYSS